MSELVIDLDRSSGVPTITLTGELDISTVGGLERALREAGAEPQLRVDLSRLGFMDSTGLRALIAAHVRAEEGGRRLTLTQGPERVQRVFRLARLEDELRFEPLRRG